MLTRREPLLKYEVMLAQRNQSRAYLPYLKILFDYLNSHNLLLVDLTEKQFFDFVAKYAISTKNLFMKSIKSYARFYNLSSPFLDKIKNKDIPLIRPDIKIKDYPTEEELNSVLPKLTEKERIITRFLIATGLRAQEFLQLKRGDIDTDKMIVKVLFGKGRKQRKVTFTQSVAEKVKQFFREETEGKNAFDYSVGDLRGLCKRLTKSLQTKVTPHSLRHSFALSCYKKGLDLVSISHLLGHSSISTSQIYLNETDDKVIENYHNIMG